MTKITRGLIRNVEDKRISTIFNSKLLKWCLENRCNFFFSFFIRRRDEYYPFVQNSRSHAQSRKFSDRYHLCVPFMSSVSIIFLTARKTWRFHLPEKMNAPLDSLTSLLTLFRRIQIKSLQFRTIHTLVWQKVTVM